MMFNFYFHTEKCRAENGSKEKKINGCEIAKLFREIKEKLQKKEQNENIKMKKKN